MSAAVFGPHPAPVADYEVSREAPLSSIQKVVRGIFMALAAVLAVGALAGVYVLCIPSILCALIALGINAPSRSFSLPVVPTVPAYHAPSPVIYSSPSVMVAPRTSRVVHAVPAADLRQGGGSFASSVPVVASGGRVAHAVPPSDVRSGQIHPSHGGHGGFVAVQRR